MWRSRKTLFTSTVRTAYGVFILFVVIAVMALGVISYVFLMMNEKQMNIKQEIDRTKILRQKANEGKKGMSIIPERELNNLEIGRQIM